MQLCDVFLALGQESFGRLVREISLGRLRTYQLFDRLKARAHLHKLNQENLRKTASRLWSRLAEERDDQLATDLGQCILVSHLDMIIEVLDFLGIAHQSGFFDKGADLSAQLAGDWQRRVYEQFGARYPGPALVFYLNHLAWEQSREAELFQPVGA